MKTLTILVTASLVLSLPVPTFLPGIIDTSPLNQPYQPPGPGGVGGSVGSTIPSKNGKISLPADGMYGIPYIEQPKPKAYANPMIANPPTVAYVTETVYALPPIAAGTVVTE
ncbi:hypothetical protein TWF281_006184 [Arthrobotrys megalospora]